jgi:DNA-binding CsgD family transcriptional regulator
LDDLVGLIYETIGDPSIWGEVTRRMAKEVSAESYWMFRVESGVFDFFASRGLSRSSLDGYAAELHKRDPLMQEEVRRSHDFVGRAVREQEILGEQAWQASEFYRERARPSGIHRILSMNLTNDRALGVPFLTFFRPRGAPAFQDETTQACSRLIPHLRRAIRLADLADTRACPIPSWTETLLDQFKSGIVLLDRRGEILHANRRCLGILDKRDGLSVKDRKLVASGQSMRGAMESRIQACCNGHSASADMIVPRAHGEWLLSICSLAAHSTVGIVGQRCRAWIWISDPNKASTELPRRLGLLFGLTAAEQRVAVALRDNLSPGDIARLHGVSINTVRTQVQHIYSKLGIRRQLELSRLLHDVGVLPSVRP